jgi:hypothetical protein
VLEGPEKDAIQLVLSRMKTDIELIERIVSSRAAPLPDPRDPRNKNGVNLSPQGVELCYRMFDQGMTRYAVKEAFGISFGAADYRHRKWLAAGGASRRSGDGVNG